MFGWFSKEARLLRAYVRKREEAELSLSKHADRALHARLTAEAEALLAQLDALRGEVHGGR